MGWRIMVVGYMGRPFGWQWIVVRNDRGQEMLDLVMDQLDVQPVDSQGDRHAAAVQQSIPAYDKGRDPAHVGRQADGGGH
jgi:coenzyme F420-reducing hydrogenase beta subunit